MEEDSMAIGPKLTQRSFKDLNKKLIMTSYDPDCEKTNILISPGEDDHEIKLPPIKIENMDLVINNECEKVEIKTSRSPRRGLIVGRGPTQKKNNMITLLPLIKEFVMKMKDKSDKYRAKSMQPLHYRIIQDLTHFDLANEEENNPHYNKFKKADTIGYKIYKYLRRSVSKRINEFLNPIKDFFRITKRKILKKITIISPTSRLKFFWDFLVMVVVLYKFFSISIHLCFYSVPLSIEALNDITHELSILENISLVVVMFLDIVLTLNMAYYENGIVVAQRKKIKEKYLKTHFIFDLLPLLACFMQLIIVLSGKESELLYLVFVTYIFFIPKYKDISKTWSDVEELFYTDEKKEAIFSLGLLFFETMVSAHITACIWHGIAFWTDTGNNNFVEDSYNWLIKSGIPSESWEVKYLNSLYFSVTTMITVGYGDISPANNLEKFICIIIMLLGCIVFGYAINRIGTILEKIGKFNKELNNNMRVINRYMKKKGIDYDLQFRVRKYLEFLWSEKMNENSEKEEQILNHLSNSLKEEVMMQSNGTFLKKFKLFSLNFSEGVLRKTLNIMKPIRFTPKEIIIKDFDDQEASIFLILNGEVDQLIGTAKAGKTFETYLQTAKPGESLNTSAFFTGRKCEVTFRSKTFATLFEIKMNDFLNIIKQSPPDYERFCMIRDNILLYDNLDMVYPTCYSCSRQSHYIHQCPKIQYIPDRDLVLRRYIYTQDQDRKNFLRSKRPKLNCLKYISDIQESIIPFKELISQMTSSYDYYEEDEQLENIKKDKEDDELKDNTTSSKSKQDINKKKHSDSRSPKEEENKNLTSLKDISVKEISEEEEKEIEQETGKLAFNSNQDVVQKRRGSRNKILDTLIQPTENAAFQRRDKKTGTLIKVELADLSRKLMVVEENTPSSFINMAKLKLPEEKNNETRTNTYPRREEVAELKHRHMGDIFVFNFDSMKNFSNYFDYNNAESITKGINTYGTAAYYKKERNRRTRNHNPNNLPLSRMLGYLDLTGLKENLKKKRKNNTKKQVRKTLIKTILNRR